MSTDNIQHRTVFYSRVNGVIRFHDWALVTTPLGTMVQPFIVNQRLAAGDDGIDIANFDFEDEEVRIDEMREVDYGSFNNLLSGDPTGMALHGGITMPRVGP